MNNDVVTTIFYIHLVPLLALAVLSLLRFSRTAPGYRPMIIFVWIILISDLIRSFNDFQSALGPIVYRLSYLLEVILIAWQVKRWGLFEKKPLLFPVLVGGFLLCWGAEMVTEPLIERISWSRILFSFAIVVMAIRMLTGILVSKPDLLSRNSAFLFSIGLMISYTFLGMWKSVMILIEEPSSALLEIMFYCSMVVITITNFIYLKAIICLPSKKKFSLS